MRAVCWSVSGEEGAELLKTIPLSEYQERELSLKELQCCCDPVNFTFMDTSELPGLREGIVGQERAVSALKFGLAMAAQGYNLFVVGPVGTGKTTYAVQKIRETAAQKPVSDDWCYVYNFQNPDQPMALRFAPGQGHRFREAVAQLVGELEQELVHQFDSEEYHQESDKILKQYTNQAEQVWALVENSARQLGLALQRTATGVATVPMTPNGKPISAEFFEQLPESEKLAFRVHKEQIEELLEETVRQINAIQKGARKAQQVLDEKTASFAIQHLFDDLFSQYSDDKVQGFLRRMQADVIRHHQEFHRDQEEDQASPLPVPDLRGGLKARYQVNVLVDRQGHEGAPVIIESNPTYFNLFGKVEYRGTAAGAMVSDYTMVKAGSMHQANGGYLIVQAQDLLTHPASWQGLKRALKNGEIRIEHPAEESTWMVQTGLRPEAIPLQVKVVLIGTPYLFHLLYANDDAFRKYFKVKVEFDAEMDRTEESCQKYADFIASFTREQNLLPFTRHAVGQVIDFSSRQAEHRHKLSTRFNPLIELVTEASFYAQQAGANQVDVVHVEKALMEKVNRSNLTKEKVLEMILDGTISVETRGERVGQINGLAVLNSGDFTFGEPHRITARTYAGRRGVVNVERETAMSGQIHDKGLLILGGYLAGEFARNRPLSVSASLVFEQTYSMIDGDSASSTELYALLSSLSGVPIKQSIAVTGSVDQFGDIQPIGGVNDKIEGFFYICQAQGLTGEQGVIIPHQNVTNLFLSDEVRQAVENGQFHIWPVRTIKEGIELLTGVEAGEGEPYPEGSVYALVEKRLQEMEGSDEGAEPQ